MKTIAFFLTYVLEMLRICNEFRDVVQSRFGAGRNRSRTAHLKRRAAACALTTEAWARAACQRRWSRRQPISIVCFAEKSKDSRRGHP
ncbi:hypothetical protein BS630_14265 [Rhizobium laguerreae]|nr:hypothetical protein BS630_14265 [Rhizobium laguerreae]